MDMPSDELDRMVRQSEVLGRQLEQLQAQRNDLGSEAYWSQLAEWLARDKTHMDELSA
jgi:hypothetical protein